MFPPIFPPVLLVIALGAGRDKPFLHHVPDIGRDQPTAIHFDFLGTTAHRVRMALARLNLAPNTINRFRQWRQLHLIPLAVNEAQFVFFAKRNMLNRWCWMIEPGVTTHLFFRAPVRAAEKPGNRIDIKRLVPDMAGWPAFGDAPWLHRDEISDMVGPGWI